MHHWDAWKRAVPGPSDRSLATATADRLPQELAKTGGKVSIAAMSNGQWQLICRDFGDVWIGWREASEAS